MDSKPRTYSGTFQHVFTPKHPGNLDDYYALDKVLGQGSFGTIYKAKVKAGQKGFHMDGDGTDTSETTDTDTCETWRAIKTVSSEMTPKRFEAEVRVQKQLDHPNVAKLYEVFQDQLKYYLVLELCTGGELFTKAVEAGGAFCENACCAYMRQLLSAINYLHGNQVAHRDIKPENLLLQSKAEDAPLKLIDFGCARTFAPGEAMTTSLGTPLYLAPEVLRRQYGSKCDVWSCGVIMYVLLCGYPPFLAPDEQALLAQLEAGRFEYEEDDWEDISDAAKELVNQMLTLDVEARPEAAALLESAWFMDHGQKAKGTLPKDLPSRLRAFMAASQFKKIALSLAAQLSNDQDIKEMQDTFLTLDQNRDGTLTQAEIAEGMTSHGISLPADFLEVLRTVDTDGSGTIDYTEFIASTLSRKQYLREELLWNIFRTFDLDGDGKIQREEFAQVVTLSEEADIASMFDEVDISKDGQIDFAELCSVMRSSPAARVPGILISAS